MGLAKRGLPVQYMVWQIDIRWIGTISGRLSKTDGSA